MTTCSVCGGLPDHSKTIKTRDKEEGGSVRTEVSHVCSRCGHHWSFGFAKLPPSPKDIQDIKIIQ